MTATVPSRPARAVVAGQPLLGLAGAALVVPLALALAAGLGSPERTLLVLAPLSTFALPVIGMIAFWWEDWPGTSLRPPLSILSDSLLVAAGAVVLTFAGQALVTHVAVRGVFDPAAGAGDAPTFPATMPLAGAIFTAMLQLTLVTEGWPLRRLGRFGAGALAFAISCAAGLGVYEALIPTGVLAGDELGAILVCIAALQVVIYVLLHGRPVAVIASRPLRLVVANAVTIAGGLLGYGLLLEVAHARPAAIGAWAGAVVAAGLIVGMLFDGWLDSLSATFAVAALTALLYAGLQALAHAAAWTRAEPEQWTAYVGLNAIGVGVLMHVAVGRRWPFSPFTGDPTPART